jgi:hypothetical protein
MRRAWIIGFLAYGLFSGAWFLRASEDLPRAHYYWRVTPAGESAQLLTLFCRSCEDATKSGRDVPLVALLRDTLGAAGSEDGRVTEVWLLTYKAPTWEKRVLSAVPFFYWKIGDGSEKVGTHEPKPLMNLSLPQRPVISSAVKRMLQLTLFDPLSTPVRATTRAYQNNQADHERLHLEEAESYLQSAPAADDAAGPTETELNTVIARLELRKSTLGGFVSAQRAPQIGEGANLEEERIRARNWELLRQCADKAGLLFEPIDLAGAKNQYAVLWFPLDRTTPPEGIDLSPVWKLLNLKDPYAERAYLPSTGSYEREINGRLGPVVPLGVYSLTYPKLPLLLVDFRDGAHLRRHELTQRTINELTSGLIGVSRITNWYYFAGADLYDFYTARRGAATNQTERLNCYSKFRVAMALDKNLDATLRATIDQRLKSLAVNPLEATPQREMRAAEQRYDLLQIAAASENSGLARRLDKQRGSELERFEASKSRRLEDNLLHFASLGIYTHRASGDGVFERLDKYRQVEYYLAFLDGLAASGTEPEVAYDTARIDYAILQLTALLPESGTPETRGHAADVIEKLRNLSADTAFKAQCVAALDSMSGNSASGLESSTRTETLR